MRSLLVLCAGSQMIEKRPLFLQTYPDGKLVAQKVIEGVFPETYDRIIYVVLSEVDQKYQASQAIRQSVGALYPVEVVCLPCQTLGPAETAYQAIQAAHIEGELAIRDSHCLIRLDKCATGNCIAGLDLTEYERTIENLRAKSFIVTNEQGQVLDVVEKRFCSDIISVGLYGFKNAKDFTMSFERLCDQNYAIGKVYVSHVISYLIGYSQRVFHILKAGDFEDWSTTNSWMKTQERYATFFLDMDSLDSFDGGLSGEMYFDVLRKITRDGACLILFTSKRNIDTQALVKQFGDRGIKVLSVVSGCTYSRTKGILNCDSLKKMDWGAYE